MVELTGLKAKIEGATEGLKFFLKGDEGEIEIVLSSPKTGGLLKVLSGQEEMIGGKYKGLGYRFYKTDGGYRLKVVRWEKEGEPPKRVAGLTLRGINLLRFLEALKKEIKNVGLVIVDDETNQRKFIKSGEVLTVQSENSTELLEPREVRELSLLLKNKEYVDFPYEHGKIKLDETGFFIGSIPLTEEDEKLLKILL
jgi:hypothetical protein